MSGRGLQHIAADPRVRRWLLAAVLASPAGAGWLALHERDRGFVLISREAWDQTPALPYDLPVQQIRRIVIHHDGVDYANGQTGEQKVAALLRAARHNEGWPDLPYHYLIDTDGRVFAGRPEHIVCETHTGYDPADTLHIALLGNYERLQPTEIQLAALLALVRDRARHYAVPAAAISVHRQVAATDCPGAHLRRRLESIDWLG